MLALDGAWRAIRRFVAGTGMAGTSDPDAGSTDGACSLNHATHADRSGLSGFYSFCRWLKERALEAHRNNALVRQEEVRNLYRAKRRAFGLMMKLMTPEQRLEFQTHKYFHVTGGSSGSRYRIRVAPFANVDVLCPDGRVKYRLCAQPAGDVPLYDVMAAQMLHLQDPVAEQHFLKRANIHPALSEDRALLELNGWRDGVTTRRE